MVRSLATTLSLLELAVQHGSQDGAGRIKELGEAFVENGREFARFRGIDATPLDRLLVRLQKLDLALRFGNSIRVDRARGDALAEIANIRARTPLLSSEAYEMHLPSWLTGQHHLEPGDVPRVSVAKTAAEDVRMSPHRGERD
jgi:hypothetical protein